MAKYNWQNKKKTNRITFSFTEGASLSSGNHTLTWSNSSTTLTVDALDFATEGVLRTGLSASSLITSPGIFNNLLEVPNGN